MLNKTEKGRVLTEKIEDLTDEQWKALAQQTEGKKLLSAEEAADDVWDEVFKDGYPRIALQIAEVKREASPEEFAAYVQSRWEEICEIYRPEIPCGEDPAEAVWAILRDKVFTAGVPM